MPSRKFSTENQMANATNSRVLRRCHHDRHPAFVLIGCDAAALPLLIAQPAAAANPCPLSSAPPISDETQGPIEITVNGTKYQLCTVKTSHETDTELLLGTPWHNNQSLAREIAEEHSKTPVANMLSTDYEGFYRGANSPADVQDNRFEGPYLLWDSRDGNGESGSASRQLFADAYVIQAQGNTAGFCPGNSSTVNASCNPDPTTDVWYLYGADPNGVPGPLPLLGAAAAFGWSRRQRRPARGEGVSGEAQLGPSAAVQWALTSGDARR